MRDIIDRCVRLFGFYASICYHVNMEAIESIPTNPWAFEPLETWGSPSMTSRCLLAERMRGLLWLRRVARAMADRLCISTATRTRATHSAMLGAEACAAGAVSAEIKARQLPPRPASQTNSGRALAAVTLAPRVLAQRPFSARRARAGSIALI